MCSSSSVPITSVSASLSDSEPRITIKIERVLWSARTQNGDYKIQIHLNYYERAKILRLIHWVNLVVRGNIRKIFDFYETINETLLIDSAATILNKSVDTIIKGVPWGRKLKCTWGERALFSLFQVISSFALMGAGGANFWF